MNFMLVFVISIFMLTALTSQVLGRHPHPCNTALNMKNQLDMQFDETVRYAGVTGKLIAKVYVSQGGSWTLVYISPDGASSCVMASGEAWHDVPWEKGQKS